MARGWRAFATTVSSTPMRRGITRSGSPRTAPSPTSGHRPNETRRPMNAPSTHEPAPHGGISMRLLAAVVLSSLGLWPSLAAAQAVKIGAVVPLTGRYGPGGAQVRAGYDIAVEQINAAGGVSMGGKKVPLELTVLDDESDATKTVARLESLGSQGVVAYLGGFGSDLHAAAASVAEKNKIPYLGIAFALHRIHQQGFKYRFSPFWKS